MSLCNICPIECGIDRENSVGRCGTTSQIKIGGAMLHMWEEPCISGKNGSGAVFFSGCNLHCIYCQNKKISTGEYGKNISIEELSDVFLDLQSKNAENINLVTAAHFLPSVRKALTRAKKNGLNIPIVYNSSGYEKADMIRTLSGLVDVYLPDFKYFNRVIAKKYSNAENYFDVAKSAIDEMVRQQECIIMDDNNMIKKGVIVRHLVLPSCINNSKRVIKYLHETYGEKIIISIMNQYTPCNTLLKYDELNRRLKKSEYNEVLEYAWSIGVKNAFTQEGGTVKESINHKYSDR